MLPIIVPVDVGSLIALQHFSGPHRLGLVVNQAVGERWVDHDPFPPAPRTNADSSLLLVRLLGEYTSDMHYPDNNDLWGEEPRRSMTVRWAYVQTRPNLPRVVAGPDTFSIEQFFGARLLSQDFGAPKFPFMVELQILIDHLKRRELVDGTGDFERRYRAMLADVLPLPLPR